MIEAVPSVSTSVAKLETQKYMLRYIRVIKV